MTGSSEQKTVNSKKRGRNSMRKKIILLALGTMLLALRVSAEAQQPAKFSRIGLLTWAASPPPSSPTPFEQGLRQLGYVEGQNIAIERRYANGQLNRLPELAADLARLPLDVILTQSFPAALAAKQATYDHPHRRHGGRRSGGDWTCR